MMNATDLQLVRSMPLFSGLDDTQLGCIEPGEVIELPAGTVLVSEGGRLPFFFVVLEGEVRLSRTYDRQTILMGIVKSGNYTGEITLLLNTHWLATARVGKPAKLFRLGEEDFWRMLSTCRSVAREIFHTAANKMRNLEGYSLQREKLVSPVNLIRCGPISSTMPFTRSTAPEKSASAPAWKTINSSSKSWTTVQAFLRMPSRICSSLFSRPNPSAPAPALASSSAIASSATVMGAKSNLNPAPVKRALECGFPSTARNLPTLDQADPEVS